MKGEGFYVFVLWYYMLSAEMLCDVEWRKFTSLGLQPFAVVATDKSIFVRVPIPFLLFPEPFFGTGGDEIHEFL